MRFGARLGLALPLRALPKIVGGTLPSNIAITLDPTRPEAVGVALAEQRGGPTSMNVLRTPEARFDRLPDFPYQPRYVGVGGPRSITSMKGKGIQFFVCMASRHGALSTGSSSARSLPTIG